MKKEYTAPRIGFESFALTANIAGGCATELNGVALFSREDSCRMYGLEGDYNECGFYDNGTVVFMDYTDCQFLPAPDNDWDDGANYNNLCCDVSSESNRMFHS